MTHDDTDRPLKNFIVFEGLDGAGTTTQLASLDAALSAKGIPHIVTAEPTNRPEGRLIRSILKGELDAAPGTVAHLFATDRYQHLYGEEGILESLGKGLVVCCDRYVLSSLAYQGVACGDDLPLHLNRRFPPAGLTLFFKVRPETAMGRVLSRNSFEIYEKLHIQKLVDAAYRRAIERQAASGFPVTDIDAEKPAPEVTVDMLKAVGAYLGVQL